jgi:uncharacterized protein (DUF4415 family)
LIQQDLRKDYGEERYIARGFYVDSSGYHIAFTFAGPGCASSACGGSARRTISDMGVKRTPEGAPEPQYGTPDEDLPDLTEEMIQDSVPGTQFVAERGRPVPGRPRSDKPKVAVSLRLDPEVIAGFKADGPGWQTRMNEALAESLKRRKTGG